MPCTKPRLPIPEPLRAAEEGTFTHYSVVARLPEIVRRVLAENEWPPATVARLEQLAADIPEAPIRHLTDTADYHLYVTPHLGQDWLQVPWFFAEAYFYRRILEATGYFQPGDGWAMDPFAYQKRQGMVTNRDAIQSLCRQLNDWLVSGWDIQAFGRLLAIDLWGNQADLSLWPAGHEGQPSHLDTAEQQAHLLVDDTAAIAAALSLTSHAGDPDRTAPGRIDFLVDNAGFELVCDLALADYLLATATAATVRLHLKPHPTFVSDAMIKDIAQTIAFLKADADISIQQLGERLAGYMTDGRLQLRDHPFWISPLPTWQMPSDLRQELTTAQLLISKGDAHYRRLLGDSHWSFTTPFTDIVCYMPAPLAALRTLKSEVAAGLTPAQLDRLDRQDADWLTNGRWGVIQYHAEAEP